MGLFVTVPGSLTKKAYEQACTRLVNDRNVAIPGFRKGQKVPEQVLLNAVGGVQVIINEALDILCEDALKKAIDDADIKAVGQVRSWLEWIGLAGRQGRLLDSHQFPRSTDRPTQGPNPNPTRLTSMDYQSTRKRHTNSHTHRPSSCPTRRSLSSRTSRASRW